jgi:hypothetical protein
MNMRLIMVAVCAGLSYSPFLSAQDVKTTVRIVDGAHGVENAFIGSAFRNRFSVASEEAARKKIENLKGSREEITVQDFLGGEIDFVRVTFFDRALTDFARSRAFLQDLLDWVILSPPYPDPTSGPQLHAYWAQGATPSVQALVFFVNGSLGRIESDGTHLFVEDAAGTYWWYVGDSGLQRKQRK